MLSGAALSGNWLRRSSKSVYDLLDQRSASGAAPMAAIPGPVTELLESALVAELTVVDPSGRPVTYPLIPLVGRRARLHDLVDPVQPQARAHRGERQGLRVDHGPDLGRRPDRSRDDPGRRPGHRRRPAWRLGTSAADLVGEGAGDRLVPQGARGAAALLRARAHRDRPRAVSCTGRRRRRHPGAAGRRAIGKEAA